MSRQSSLPINALLSLSLLMAPCLARAQTRSEGMVDAGSGIQLYYRTVGSGGDTIVVLHGGPGFSSSYFGPDLDRLASSHTLIFYDQRGSGRSTLIHDSTKVSAALHVADLEAVRRHFHLDSLNLLGHSWGAGLAVLYAIAHPAHVGSMVLYDAIPPRALPYGQQFNHNVTAWMDSTELDHFHQLAQTRSVSSDTIAACRAFAAMIIIGYLADSASVGRFHGDLCDNPPASLANRVSAWTLDPLGDWDWRHDAAAIRVPTLVIHGAHDPIPLESAREWVATIPTSRLLVIDGAGHFAHIERPEVFFPAVNAFFDRVSRNRHTNNAAIRFTSTLKRGKCPRCHATARLKNFSFERSAETLRSLKT